MAGVEINRRGAENAEATALGDLSGSAVGWGC